MKKLTNFFNCAANGLQKTGGGNSQSQRSESVRSTTLAGRRLSNTLITHESPTNHPLKQCVWKYVACMLMVLFMGVGNAWGAASTTTDGATASGTITFDEVGTLSAQNTYWYNGLKFYEQSTNSMSNDKAKRWAAAVTPCQYGTFTSGENWQAGTYDMTGLIMQAHCLAINVSSACTIEIVVNMSGKTLGQSNPVVPGNLKVLWDGTAYNTAYTSSNYKTGTAKTDTTWEQNINGKYNRMKLSIPVSAADLEAKSIDVIKVSYTGSATGTPSYSQAFVYESVKIVVATTHSVTYKANGGTGSDVVDDAATTIAANTFTAPSGKVFSGWNTQADGEGTPYTVGASVSGDLELYAQWVDGYTVSFDMQGHGSAIAAVDVAAGGTITAPTAPTADGYSFLGWYKEAGCTNAWDFDNDVVNAATTLYAKWLALGLPLATFPSGETLLKNTKWTTTTKNINIYEDYNRIMMYSKGNPISIDNNKGIRIGNSSDPSAFVFYVGAISDIEVTLSDNGKDITTTLYYLGTSTEVLDPSSNFTTGTQCDQTSISNGEGEKTLSYENGAVGYYKIHSTKTFYAKSISLTTAAPSCAATANAGADKETTVNVGVAMAATAATSGYTGAWSIKAGSPSEATSQLGTTSSNTMTFTPNTTGTYTLVWTVTDNSDGSCYDSDEATVTVSATPKIDVAAPTGLSSTAQTATSLTFGWTAAEHASSYDVYLYTDAGCETLATTTESNPQNVNTTSATFNGLTVSTTYYCKVQSKGDGDTYATNGGITATAASEETPCTAITPTWVYPFTKIAVGITPSNPIDGNLGEGAVTYSSSATSYIDNNCYAKAAGSATITANVAAANNYCAGNVTSGTIEVVADQTGIITQALATGSNAWSASTPTTTDGTNITNLVALHAVGFTISTSENNGNDKNGGQTAKVSSVNAESCDNDKYLEMSFTVADGKQLNVSAIYIPVQPVTSNSGKFKAVLSDGTTDIEGTVSNIPNGKLDYIRFASSGTLQGNVTLKIYAWNWNAGYRLGRNVIIAGTVENIPVSCSAYEFHYGTKTQDNWEIECFAQVGETKEWRITNFAVPSSTHYYVGYHGDGEGTSGWNATWSAEKQWTDTYSDGNGAMVLLPGTSAVGQATGAQGSLIIWSDSGEKNKYVGFQPNGYGITYGGNSYAFAATATANVWETDVVTLPDVSTEYTMGLATATEGTYVACAHSAAAEAISGMGVTILDGGKKKLYLNAGVWRTEEGTGEKIAIFDFTNSRAYWGANDNSFMTYNSTLGLYEGYVLSDATNIIFVRINKDQETPAWGEDISWNQTADITLGSLANTYAITGWTDGTDGKSGHSVTPIHPATGQKGKFRMWDNSSAQNWYVHFVPYYTLSYNGNGGSGEMAATERSAESASTTVTVAANGFTAPAGKHFAGWAISQENADAGTIDYAAGDDYTLTADATLFAVWETTYAQSIDLATYAGSHSGTAWQGYLNENGYSYVLGSEEGAEISLDKNNDFDTGLKLKMSTTSNISFSVAAGKMIKIVTGKVNGLSIAINGGAATAIPSGTDATHLATSYYYNAAVQNVVITETNTGYNIIREISIENPYTVTYNANGGEDVAAATFYGTALTLPSASKGTDSFLGWFTEASGGTKIGEAGGSYTPSASIELFAHWEAVSTDARLASITFSSNAGTLEPAFDPEVVNYTYTMPYGTADIPTIVSATSVNAKAKTPVIGDAATAWGGTQYVRGVAQSDDTKQYNITMKIAPKDGVSLIKVATTGGTNKTVTGAYAGDGDVNLSSGDKARKMDKGKYIGFTLDGTTLQAGDRINVHTTQAANNSGSHIIFYDNMTDKNKLYDTEAIGGTGNNIFTINASMVGATTAYVYRSSDDAPDNWNGFVDYIEVTRAMNPVLTAISFNSVAATKGTGTTFSVELPKGTTLGTMTVEPTVIRNAAHATTPQAVITNEGAWAWGENTYRVMDKDNDYTDYTITLTEALAPAETPVIATQPADASFCAGGSAALSVAVNDVSDGGTLSYAWFKKGSPDEAVGTNSDSYAATAVGTYYVKVTNTTAGKAPVTVQSEDADVTLNVAATITTQPESQDYIVSGSQVSLSVVASNATGYQWYSCEDAEKTNAAVIPGEDEANYTFTCTADGYYYCVVGNACGDDIASDVVSVKLEPQGCNAIASIPSEKPYQYVQTGEWTLYGIDSDGRINGSNKFVNNAKDFNNNTVNAITDQRVGIIFDKDVESITIYATATSTGRAWKSDQQIRVTSDAITEGVNPKPVYANVSATRTVTTMPGENKQYIFTAEDMLLEAGKKVWLPFSGELTIFRICYTAAPEKCVAPVLPALASKELCAGVSEAWDATATVSDEGTLSYQWYNADTDEAIEGADEAEFTPAADGNYYVIVTNSKTGYRDNSTKSAVLSVEHFAGTTITEGLAHVRKTAGEAATLTVEATGKDLHYAWKECETIDGTYTDVAGAADSKSLEIIVPDGIKYYKVIVSSGCGANQESIAKVEKFVPVAQVVVSTSVSWDLTTCADAMITLDGTTSPKKGEECLMANIEGVHMDENFHSESLVFEGEYIYRTSEGVSGTPTCAEYMKFETSVAGLVRVHFAGNGSNRCLRITSSDGVQYSSVSAGTSDDLTEQFEVAAGEIELMGLNGDHTGNKKYMRFYQIEFYALDKVRDDSWIAPRELGTVCYPNGHIVVGADMYQMAGVNANGKFAFDQVEVTEPGVPYLFEATGYDPIKFYKTTAATVDEPGTSNGMVGTFVQMTLSPATDVNAYYFQGTHFYAVADRTKDLTVPANRCYVDLTEPHAAAAPRAGVRRITFGVNGTNGATGFENIEASEKPMKLLIDGKIYILRGEKMFDATGRLVK